jgi:hypothetical protein
MKTMLTLAICLAAAGLIAQDNFTVIKVTGKVFSQKYGRSLTSNDKINSKDALQFESKDASIILLSPKTGRKLIKGVPDSSPREFMQLLESFVKPSEKSTATRSAGAEYFSKLEHMLAHDSILILGDGKIMIDTTKLKISGITGIRVIYKKGKANVVKKISDSNSFSLSRTTLFDQESPKPTPRVTIQYYLNEKEDYAFADAEIIGEFIPLYADEAQIKLEVRAVIDALADNKLVSADLLKEIKDYLDTVYGPTMNENLRPWLAANQLIK